MLYTFFQFIIRKSLVIHYRKIKAFNLANVPKSGPLIIAASHPNSFLDAIIIAALIDRPLYFLARGDVFHKNWAKVMLQFLNLIPIYRLQEGGENLHKNQDTFHKCHQILEQDGALLMFPEGTSKLDKTLHPLRKGLARIAFGFIEKHEFRKKLSILAVGVNYDNPKKFDNKVFIGFGTPFTLNPWIKQYKNNHNKAFTEFNQYLYYSIQKQFIEVDQEDYDLYEAIAQIDPSYKNQSLDRLRLIAGKIKQLKTENPHNYLQLKKESRKTKEKLQQHQLKFKHLKHPIKLSALEVVLNIILLPLSLFALIFNSWPYYLGKSLAKKLPAEHYQFTYSVIFAVGTLSWLIFIITLIIILSLSLSQWFLLCPILFYWSMLAFKRLYKNVRKINLILRLNKLKSKEKAHKEVIEDLKSVINLRNTFKLMPND